MPGKFSPQLSVTTCFLLQGLPGPQGATGESGKSGEQVSAPENPSLQQHSHTHTHTHTHTRTQMLAAEPCSPPRFLLCSPSHPLLSLALSPFCLSLLLLLFGLPSLPLFFNSFSLSFPLSLIFSLSLSLSLCLSLFPYSLSLFFPSLPVFL